MVIELTCNTLFFLNINAHLQDPPSPKPMLKHPLNFSAPSALYIPG